VRRALAVIDADSAPLTLLATLAALIHPDKTLSRRRAALLLLMQTVMLLIHLIPVSVIVFALQRIAKTVSISPTK